jgi:ABC-type sugar transport system ATPase subunit
VSLLAVHGSGILVATVRLHNLTKMYAGGGVKAVDGLSLDIADGAFLVLVGLDCRSACRC